jgi:hypothetical protein
VRSVRQQRETESGEAETGEAGRIEGKINAIPEL